MQVLFQLSYSPTERGVYQRVRFNPFARRFCADQSGVMSTPTNMIVSEALWPAESVTVSVPVVKLNTSNPA